MPSRKPSLNTLLEYIGMAVLARVHDLFGPLFDAFFQTLLLTCYTDSNVTDKFTHVDELTLLCYHYPFQFFRVFQEH